MNGKDEKDADKIPVPEALDPLRGELEDEAKKETDEPKIKKEEILKKEVMKDPVIKEEVPATINEKI